MRQALPKKKQSPQSSPGSELRSKGKSLRSAARDELFAIFSDEVLDYQHKLEDMLAVGVKYFGLECATVSMIVGDRFEVKCAHGDYLGALNAGTQLDLNDTFCGQFVDTDALLAVDDIANSNLSELPCYELSNIESFIGTIINTASGPYGAVSFTSSSARQRVYSDEDREFLTYIGSWIGVVVGNQEHLEFIANQSEYYQSVFQTVPAMMFWFDYFCQ